LPRTSSHRVDRRRGAQDERRPTPEKHVNDHRLLLRELDPDEGEVTPTRKIKRDVVARRFTDMIEDMYRDDASMASSDAG
jgi:long-subunit acyl-CoA synthetase (AMP-forming)